MESWITFLHGPYVTSYESETWFEKYPDYEDDIEENKKLLENLLENGLDPTDAFREYLSILPKCYRYFMCNDDETKEVLLTVLLDQGADTKDILDFINIDFDIEDNFEDIIHDYNIRGWLISYFIKKEKLTIQDVNIYFDCDWNSIEPEYWEDIDDPEQDTKLSCLKYLKYCSILDIVQSE